VNNRRRRSRSPRKPDHTFIPLPDSFISPIKYGNTAPWLSPDTKNLREVLLCLHSEIIDFYQYMKLTDIEKKNK
jgi:hypothetical protein